VAKYVRVPFTKTNLIPIPLTYNTTNLTIEHDYLTVFELGNSVAVFGAGPVRLLFTYLAILRRVSKVYVVKYIKQYLTLTAFISAIPINFINKDLIT
ncbi:alcohol dehydrogenase GroES-like domain-containing protein, partial [Colletotrichum lupini]